MISKLNHVKFGSKLASATVTWPAQEFGGWAKCLISGE